MIWSRNLLITIQKLSCFRHCLRNYFEVLVGSEAHSSTSPKVSELELPWKVLESLFNTPRSSEHKPSTMNWRNMVKKMEALGQSSQVCTSRDEEPKPHADGILIAYINCLSLWVYCVFLFHL